MMVDGLHLFGESRWEKSGMGMVSRLGVGLNKEVMVECIL